MSTVIDDVLQKRRKPKVRLIGYLSKYVAEKQFGFVTVPGVTNGETRKPKEWFFHHNALRSQSDVAYLTAGIEVEFTPRVTKKAGKSDLASDVVVTN